MNGIQKDFHLNSNWLTEENASDNRLKRKWGKGMGDDEDSEGRQLRVDWSEEDEGAWGNVWLERRWIDWRRNVDGIVNFVWRHKSNVGLRSSLTGIETNDAARFNVFESINAELCLGLNIAENGIEKSNVSFLFFSFFFSWRKSSFYVVHFHSIRSKIDNDSMEIFFFFFVRFYFTVGRSGEAAESLRLVSFWFRRSNARSVVKIGKPWPVRFAYLLVKSVPRWGNVRVFCSI